VCESEEDISSEAMQAMHDDQLRNMKERWNLLQTLRKEKKTQKTPGMLLLIHNYPMRACIFVN
jgi:hypothetical protein